MSADTKILSRRLRQRRFELDLPQHVVADHAGIPPLLLSRLENGRYTTVRPEVIPALATALHTSTDYLLGHAPQDTEA